METLPRGTRNDSVGRARAWAHVLAFASLLSIGSTVGCGGDAGSEQRVERPSRDRAMPPPSSTVEDNDGPTAPRTGAARPKAGEGDD